MAGCSSGGGDSGGNGGGNVGGSDATITGTVAGTVVVALDGNNREVASSTAIGSPKRFSLAVPSGGSYRFYFIENENTPNETVFPLYQGATNVFSIASAVTIDLGFVDTTSGQAVPTNNPLDVSGVASGGEDASLPPFLSFAGTYDNISYQYDLNIQDGVEPLGADTETLPMIRVDSTNFSLGPFPLVRSGNVLTLKERPFVTDSANFLDLLFLSDGNNAAYAIVGQEPDDATDISFQVANFLRSQPSEPVTADTFVGTWSGTLYVDDNLRDTTQGFVPISVSAAILKVASDTITATVQVNNRDEIFTLGVADGRATLVGAPVTTTSAIEHAVSIVSDGSGLSLYGVFSEVADPSDVSIAVGLMTRQVSGGSPSIETFSPAGTMNTARAGHTATLLADGVVLIAGGFSAASDTAPALNTAELFDPVAKTFTNISATMASPRIFHTATRLQNGLVLLAGGQSDTNDGDGADIAELFNPATQTFTALSATMTSPRGGHAAVLLPDGKVLLMGGFNNSSMSLNSAEVFDPVTQTFTALTATMTSGRSDFTSTLLPNGKVLLTGGDSSDTTLDTAELFDPTSQTFSSVAATMTSARMGHTATLLGNGLVLVAGGVDIGPAFPSASIVYNTTEVYDPASQVFTTTDVTLTTPRFFHAQTLLATGSVLLTGGSNVESSNSFVVLSTAESSSP
jgi:N-acetylneuraminic acid mutarotase